MSDLSNEADNKGTSRRFIVACVVTFFMATALPAMFMLGVTGYAAGKLFDLPGMQLAYGPLMKVGCAKVVKKPSDIMLDGASGAANFAGNVVGWAGDKVNGVFEFAADGASEVPFLGKPASQMLKGAGFVTSGPLKLLSVVSKGGAGALEAAKQLRDLACKLKEVESTFRRSGLDEQLRVALACGDLEKTYGKKILDYCIKNDQANDSARDVPLWLLPVYQAAGNKYHVPWELLAAVNWNDTEYGALGNWMDFDKENRNRIGWIPMTRPEWKAGFSDGGYAPPHNPFDPYRNRFNRKKRTCPMPVDPRQKKNGANPVSTLGGGGVPGARQLPRKKGQKPVPMSKIPGGRYEATAYGPPWDGPNGMEGSGITSQGTKLGNNPGPYKKYYLIAVDPKTIPYGSYVYVWPNPFNYRGTFKADDTGGAFLNQGKKLDFYDWRGRASQNKWGRRMVTVTPAAGPSGGAPTNVPVSLIPDMTYDTCDPVDSIFALAKWFSKHGTKGGYWDEAIRLAASGSDTEAKNEQDQKKLASNKYLQMLKDAAIPIQAGDRQQTPELKWPTASHDVAQQFQSEGLEGILVATRRDAEVGAMEDGTVLKVDRTGNFYGREVCMRHTRVMVSCLGGLTDIKVKEGQKLKKGDEIGRSGEIDRKQRVYIEIRLAGKPINPSEVLPLDLGGGGVSGPIASRIVELAKAEYAKGVKEVPDGSNNAPDISRYRKATVGAMSGAPWCSYFTSYIAKMAGVPVGNNGEGFGLAQANYTWGQTKKISFTREQGGQAGDLIVFGGSGHVGIVIAKQGGYYTTIEGNYSNQVAKVKRSASDPNIMGFVRLAKLKNQDGGGNGDAGDMKSGPASDQVPTEGGAGNSFVSDIDGVIAQSLDQRDAPINSMLCPNATRYAECIAILYLRIMRGPNQDEEQLGQDLGGGCGAKTSVPNVKLRPLTNAKIIKDPGEKGLYVSKGTWGRKDAITGLQAVMKLFQQCNPRFKKNWQLATTNDWGAGAIDGGKGVSGHLSHQNGGDVDTTTQGVSEMESDAYSVKDSVELASMFLRAGAVEIYFDDPKVQQALVKLRKMDRTRYPAANKQLLKDGSWRDCPVTWAYGGVCADASGLANNSNHRDHFHVRWYHGAANNTDKNSVKVWLGEGGQLGGDAGGPFRGNGNVDKAIQWAQKRQGTVSFAYQAPSTKTDGLDEYRTFNLRSTVKVLIALELLRQKANRPLSSREMSQLRAMLTRSDNAAADALYEKIGGERALNELAGELNLRSFRAAPNSGSSTWGDADASANDMLSVFSQLEQRTPSAYRDELLGMMRSVIEEQSWGIPAGWPGNSWAFKGGWKLTDVHQCGIADADINQAVLCVFTSGNPSQSYGQQTIEGIAKILRGDPGAPLPVDPDRKAREEAQRQVGKGWAPTNPGIWSCSGNLDLYQDIDEYAKCKKQGKKKR